LFPRGESLQDGHQFAAALGLGDLVFGSGGRIAMVGLLGIEGDAALGVGARSETEIVAGAEDPGSEVGARFAVLEVPEEGEEDLLGHFFGIVRGKAQGEEIAEERRSPLTEHEGDFVFEGGVGACAIEPGQLQE